MTITVDTNILVRALTGDDARQTRAARSTLEKADGIALTLTVLCELVWVLSRGYGIGAAEIADAIRRLIDADNVVSNRPAVEAGLALLNAGGDFADGVIAHDGRSFGASVFVSFDRKAVKLINAAGGAARLI